MGLPVLPSWKHSFHPFQCLVLPDLCCLLSPAVVFTGPTFQLAFPESLGLKLSSKGELMCIDALLVGKFY